MQLLDIADSTARDLCKQYKIDLWSLGKANIDLLGQLKEAGVVGPMTSKLCLIMMSGALKLGKVGLSTSKVGDGLNWAYLNSKGPASHQRHSVLASLRRPVAGTATVRGTTGGRRGEEESPPRQEMDEQQQQQQQQQATPDPAWHNGMPAGQPAVSSPGSARLGQIPPPGFPALGYNDEESLEDVMDGQSMYGSIRGGAPRPPPPPFRMYPGRPVLPQAEEDQGLCRLPPWRGNSGSAFPTPPSGIRQPALPRQPPPAPAMKRYTPPAFFPTIPPPPPAVVFPTSLPAVLLDVAESREAYALQRPGALLRAEIKQYEGWCGAPVNTERRGRYISAVQSTTLERVESMVLGYLGYVSQHFALDARTLTLDVYAHPGYLAQFFAYLKVIQSGDFKDA